MIFMQLQASPWLAVSHSIQDILQRVFFDRFHIISKFKQQKSQNWPKWHDGPFACEPAQIKNGVTGLNVAHFRCWNLKFPSGDNLDKMALSQRRVSEQQNY